MFVTEEPFRHMVVDGLFSDESLEHVLANWPTDEWKQFRNGKRATYGKQVPLVKQFPVVQKLLSREFVSTLEPVMGIPNLIADESLFGGGLHEIMPGGGLKIHVDFNRLGVLYRRVNLMVYLNQDWLPEWGGALELWKDVDGSPAELAVTIEPKFNRTVVFTYGEKSWHGHPHSLACPKGVTRKSLAFYYYTKERPDWYVEDHTTIYKDPA